MRLRAMAKINLGLDILGKRDDGYHEVRMLMQTIQMYDLLDIRRKSSPGITLTTNLLYVPSDERNLVYKAAKLLMDEFDIQEGISMKLTKSIPVAAGMAGGSSDAAAAFVGVNKMFHLGLSEQELMERAVQIGADVPYCIMRGTALAEGIGEKLTRLPQLPKCYILVGKPAVNVSTKLAYENLDLQNMGAHPDIDGMISDIENGDLYTMVSRMGNVFEPGIIGKYPVIQEIKEVKRARIKTYLDYVPTAKYFEGCQGIWTVPCGIALPCATQNELPLEGAKALVEHGCFAVAEGANMPSTPEAVAWFQEHGVLFAPAKASNAGGVATSGLEMSQNSERLSWTFEEVDAKLKGIMEGIFHASYDASVAAGSEGNLMVGANCAGFLKVATAMMAQGITY